MVLSAALANGVLPAQHLKMLNTPIWPYVLQTYALLPHFLSAVKSLLQTTRALGLVEEYAIRFCQHSH